LTPPLERFVDHRGGFVHVRHLDDSASVPLLLGSEPHPLRASYAVRTRDDVENFLIELELPFERLDDGLWVVVNEDDHSENVVVYLADRILSFRVKVFDLPLEPAPKLLHRLLELNATDIVHGAYGMEGNSVVLVAALELENLDLNEFQAILDSFGLAISSHHEELTTHLS
jgi:hypothetical protein